jgi:hypothetical protein
MKPLKIRWYQNSLKFFFLMESGVLKRMTSASVLERVSPLQLGVAQVLSEVCCGLKENGSCARMLPAFSHVMLQVYCSVAFT